MTKIPVLPTLVTLGNGFCGLLAIVMVLQARADSATGNIIASAQALTWAGWLILFAMVFDALDGKVARLANATSDFGTQLDSLCDVISFGVAPAVIVAGLATYQDRFPRVAIAAGAFYMLCAAMRLARFNVETRPEEEAHRFFSGLPSPGAAAFVATMTIMVHELRGGTEPEFAGIAGYLAPVMDNLLIIMPFVAVLLGLLMISRIRYVHVVTTLLRGQEPLDYLVKVILIAILAILTRPFSLPLLVGIYIVWGLIAWLKDQLFHRIPVEAKESAPRE
jgi:CDP-diacylglycerol--serine O-phosphatidyltransferase